MKTSYIFGFLLLTGFLFYFPIHAQEIQGEVDFLVGIPRGEFKEQLNRAGVGIGFIGGYRFKKSPFMLGLDFGYLSYGSDKSDVRIFTAPEFPLELVNKYNFINLDFLIRLIQSNPDALFRPYLDGLFGINYLSTDTVLREKGILGSGRELLQETSFNDTVLNYGVGAGLLIRIYQPPKQEKTLGEIIARGVYLNLTGRYMFGGEAEYLKKGSIRRENGQVFYDVSKSNTDLFYMKLGIVLNI